jgi:hypothetical protein
MPSDKEMRVWLIALLVLVWVGVGLGIADHFWWSPVATPTKVRLQSYGVEALRLVGMLLGTRVLYGLLRAPGQQDNG